jgi:hypothetical protein
MDGLWPHTFGFEVDNFGANLSDKIIFGHKNERKLVFARF